MADATVAIPFASANQKLRDVGYSDGSLAPEIYVGEGFATADSRKILAVTSQRSLFTDDFGGSTLAGDIALGGTLWRVLNGGLGANQSFGAGTLTQAAIGSGITGITYAVASSQLQITMPTTAGAELWFLSEKTFTGKEHISVLLNKSQALAANSIFIGLVEVDPTTLVPIVNANIAADANGAREFQNRGGCEFAQSATATAFRAEAIGDGSGTIALGGTGVATAWTTTQETLIKVDSLDVTVTTALRDSVVARVSTGSRVSTQAPNDNKLYKLVIRVRNVSVAGSGTTVLLERIIVLDNHEIRATIADGDTIASEGVPVNLVGVASATMVLGTVALVPNATIGPNTTHRLLSAATTNATSVKATTGTILGGILLNTAATTKYVKFYQKVSAPTVGTDTPVLTIPLTAAGTPGCVAYLGELFGAAGYHMATGIAYAITGAYADADTTAVAAGDVIVQLIYT